MAVDTPIANNIKKAHEKNIPILGICNGFQILIQLGLLPGKLIENKNKSFMSKLYGYLYQDKLANYKVLLICISQIITEIIKIIKLKKILYF